MPPSGSMHEEDRDRGSRSGPENNKNTVNSETLARVLFSRNFAYAKFCENKTLAIWLDHFGR